MTPSAMHLPADLSVRAAGLLEPFQSAGVLGTGDVQVAAAVLRIADPSPRGGSDDELVALATALCVRALRHGSVTVDLTRVGDQASVSDDGEVATGLPWPDPTTWLDALEHHPAVARGEHVADRPLVLSDVHLSLQKYRKLETTVRDALVARCRPDAGSTSDERVDDDRRILAELFPDPAPDRQRLAVAAVLSSRLTILAGGPGTGKTTTIARMIAALRLREGPALRIALAAPTGKAAARLQDAANAELAGLPGGGDTTEPVEAVTVHRLLGWFPDPARPFRHDRNHPLPHDVVIVDETSMVDLPLMSHLVDAVRPDARLVLVGDPDQLASVDAGAVLGDLVAVRAEPPGGPLITRLAPRDEPGSVSGCGTVTLTDTHRFHGGIADLAAALRSGDADRVVEVLTDATVDDVVFTDSATVTPDDTARLRHEVTVWAETVTSCARSGDAAAALTALDHYRILCAHRRGPHGVSQWNALIRSWLPRRTDDHWQEGQGVIVTRNDATLGVHNGDAGVVVAGRGGPVVAFARPGEPLLIPAIRLADALPLDAMTIHRAQGSQFAEVTVVLPDPESPLLTRELLYTAVTRARERVRILGSEAAVRAAVERRVVRASRLTERMTQALSPPG
ncbi:MAG: exodeoxyribonuclease V subunit alpha [Candidatus Nanopelagicales bacterium]